MNGPIKTPPSTLPPISNCEKLPIEHPAEDECSDQNTPVNPRPCAAPRDTIRPRSGAGAPESCYPQPPPLHKTL